MKITERKLSSSLSALIGLAFLMSTLCCATDTINGSQIVRDGNNDTLISARGDFELGFYSPKGSTNRYVGIWYKKIANRTVVWVANRDNPLTDTSGEFKLLQTGLLVILNATNGTIIWSTNTSRSVQDPVAQLLDTGNLVVRDAADDGEPLWQSFDYPTDSFLPGMKLGKNLVTGLEIYITSSKSESDPASGDFNFYCDPTGYPQNVIRKGDAVTYRTGPWNGQGFSGNPNLKKNSLFTFGMVINEKQVFYSYDLINASLYMRFTLSNSGYGNRLIWVERTQEWETYLVVPGDNCDFYNGCGPYGSCNIKNSPSCGCMDKFVLKDPQSQESGDWSNGCIRRTPLNCEKGDGFVKYSVLKLPDTRSSRYNKSMSIDECKDACSRDCSCMAYSSLDISRGESGCLLWFGDLIDMREISPGQDIFIRMASSELDSNRKKRRIFVVALSLVVGTLLLCLGLLFYLKKRKKVDHQPRESGRQRFNYMDYHSDQSHQELELPTFDLSIIKKATENFSIHKKLGEGGFGSVYMGRMDDGQEIAVKRLSSTSVQGVDEFKNEVICIAELQHRNLVKLLGCCIQGEERMLIYEYMTNRSLDLILFDPLNSILLDWRMRFNIINGVARGLMYLHQDSRLRVIHRDLKASNILLDANMNPKISDFGIARIFGGNQTGANTSRVVGTYGYMSPEYAMDGLFSVKSDVYSFGVVVLEIVSGKRNRGIYSRDQRLNLLGHAWMLFREERSLELVDPGMRETCNLSEIARLIHVGLLCVQEEPEERPTMSSVVVMLSNDGVLPDPKHPGFFARRDAALQYVTAFFTNTSTSSNSMTITQPEPR